MNSKDFTILSRGEGKSAKGGPRVRMRADAFLLVMKKGVSHRGLQYMKLMCEGLTFKEIAKRVGVAPKTVDNTMQIHYRKMGLRGATAAVAWYVRNIEFSK